MTVKHFYYQVHIRFANSSGKSVKSDHYFNILCVSEAVKSSELSVSRGLNTPAGLMENLLCSWKEDSV